MRPYKRCASRNITYLLGEASEKCLAYIDSGKSCNLAIPLSKLRRVYKERIRVRNDIRKLKAKLYRIEIQLRDLENKEEDLVNSKQSIIYSLEEEEAGKSEEKSKEPEGFNLPFDILSEEFRLPDNNWSLFAFGPLDLNVPLSPVSKTAVASSSSLRGIPQVPIYFLKQGNLSI